MVDNDTNVKVINPREAIEGEFSNLLNRTGWLHELNSSSSLNNPSAEFSEWIFQSLNILEKTFGQQSTYYEAFSSLNWEIDGYKLTRTPDNSMVIFNKTSPDTTWFQTFRTQLNIGKGILKAALSEVQRTNDIKDLYQGKDTPPETSLLFKVINLAEHKLRVAIRDVPTAEKEVQDAFETLLVGADIPYSRETEHIEYSSKAYIPDFIIGKIDLAIEMKFCNRVSREKEIISEINDDILAYQTKHANILFIVYDIGLIRDVERFITGFLENEHVLIKIVKH